MANGVFAGIATLFTTGSVNAMHDSFTPIGGMGTMIGMMLQCVYGGKGVGFLNALIFGVIGVFIAGLMVGRTPRSTSARRSSGRRSSSFRLRSSSTRSSSWRRRPGR